jgi:hypothetical protein
MLNYQRVRRRNMGEMDGTRIFQLWMDFPTKGFQFLILDWDSWLIEMKSIRNPSNYTSMKAAEEGTRSFYLLIYSDEGFDRHVHGVTQWMVVVYLRHLESNASQPKTKLGSTWIKSTRYITNRGIKTIIDPPKLQFSWGTWDWTG